MVEIIQQNRTVKEIVDKLEDYADVVVRKTRRYIPHVARICLVSTFIEDGLRLLTQWGEQVEYIQSVWSIPYFLACLFILINIISQFVGSGFIIGRYQVKIGVGILMGTVALQTVGYHIWTRVFLMRNLALVGSLLLLLAEANQESRSVLAGLPSTGENASQQYMLLGGRILIVLMFITLIHWVASFLYVLQAFLNLVLIILVALGYKTKLCATILVFWLSLTNFIYNDFWNSSHDSMMWDFLKYDFFQTWSVIGGLLLIVAYGPGGVSLDEHKKKW